MSTDLKLSQLGNLGKDPEMRYMPDGTPVTNINVASTEKWTSKTGEKQSRTTWIRWAIWNKRGETANQYLSKGDKVLIWGRLDPDANGGPRVWTGQDGSARASFEAKADGFTIVLCKRWQEDNGETENEPVPQTTDYPF